MRNKIAKSDTSPMPRPSAFSSAVPAVPTLRDSSAPASTGADLSASLGLNSSTSCPYQRSVPAIRRWIYVAIGSISVAVGTIGLFVPGLPTTIFLIVASWFFVRSSPSLHQKLISHPRLGPPLRRFMESRAMPRRAKIGAVVSMWLGIGTALLLTWPAPLFLPAVLVTLGVTGSCVVLFCVRTLPRSEVARVRKPAAPTHPAVSGR